MTSIPSSTCSDITSCLARATIFLCSESNEGGTLFHFIFNNVKSDITRLNCQSSTFQINFSVVIFMFLQCSPDSSLPQFEPIRDLEVFGFGITSNCRCFKWHIAEINSIFYDLIWGLQSLILQLLNITFGPTMQARNHCLPDILEQAVTLWGKWSTSYNL